MSETITEMILPGTYIDVRAEGLIGVGGISTGNIGVVGTASRGEVNKVFVISSYSEALDLFGPYDAWPSTASAQANALTLTRTIEQLFRGGASTVYAVRVGDFTGTPPVMTWSISDGGGVVLGLQANSPGTWANAITVSLNTTDHTLQVVLGTQKETHDASTVAKLAAAIAADSRFLVVTAAPAPADVAKVPTTVTPGTAVGSNGESAGGGTSVATGLDLLAPETVNIVVIGGVGAKDAKANMLAHLEATENDGKERIGVLGVSKDAFTSLEPNDIVSNARVILVTPGIKADDAVSKTQVTLPGAYAAALVAGRLSTLGVHISLTNKDIAAAGLAQAYTRGQQKNLLGKQMLVLRNELGIRVLKGITTDTGAFRQISVRRTVDYAKAGVRIGSNAYIGRLNNVRVRAALKATLDGFLSQMVLDEMLVGYTLDVSATRSQEINGQAIVTMTLQPTFSIDFVKVIMNLQ
ncbi:MAG TPA: phage tail sheath C-terminal domain-containing protein [Gemmatimonadaceae bacterium]